MKHLLQYIKPIVCFLLIIITLIFSSSSVLAHEIYYDSSSGRTIRFRLKDLNSNKKPVLYVYYNQLRNDDVPENYYDCAIAAIDAWDGFANITDGGCNQLAPTNRNIIITSYSEDAYSAYGVDTSTLALTVSFDINGNDTSLANVSSMLGQTITIDYSVIYMHPTGSVFKHLLISNAKLNKRIKKTIVHEIGHAIGLGHSDDSSYNPISSSTFSVMRQGFPDHVNSGVVPQDHEYYDVYSAYPFGG